ncbi:hypothetical protein R55210_AODCCCNP_01262 [Fructobacillus fructosus]|uniref:DUF3021 domain-containing protein n=1 Tax=Fructobacillus fructosus TaxID=1631 RepID=UPI0002195C92|nr:DUF3021 domain-containing protein [Fructobacillus fructosus]KRN52959.1 hypothetical protein IV71_GL000860 [Fructobacillus fructosus KCTC 3544]CAK1243464.1 hypothetical protein R54866_LGPIEIPA_01011 [Fructobacillus fructosus]CAK1244188.1 hypothetical protein LMG30234_GAICNKDF_01057 [Fructobacillus fructosus]CAK1245122.1 hypothetical protein LMG30235_GOPAMIKF_01119 [Fructobacillus fructosus]CAK1249765.1 hypothetical protein R55210_AODCCCNP_01262 [Fructobacillus fructosus]
MRNIIQHVLKGIAFGSSSYVIILALTSSSEAYMPRENIIAVLAMSAVIGLWSMIFEWEGPNFLTVFILHFLGSGAIVWATGHLVRCFYLSVDNPVVWVYFVTTYVVIWLIILFNQRRQVAAINSIINQRDAAHQNEKD